MAASSVTSPPKDDKIFPMKAHPYALRFPALSADEYENLKDGIAADGQLNVITIHESMVLDGWHRYQACRELGIEPRLGNLPPGIDAWRFVIQQNLRRRHMTTGQRALMAARMVTTEHGTNRFTKVDSSIELSIITQSEAARLCEVSVASLKRAEYILRHGGEELIQQLENKKVSLHAAEKKAQQNFEREKAKAAALKAAADDKPVVTPPLVDPDPVELDPKLPPLPESEYEAKLAMQEAWTDKQIAAWEKEEQKSPAQVEVIENQESIDTPLEKSSGTTTSSFGTSGRINHDSSEFYDSKMYHDLSHGGEIGYRENPIDTGNLNRVFCKSSVYMDELPDNSVHLMVTSPPYNVGKQYDDDLSLDEYRALLTSVFQETYRVLVPGGRACINVANLGRKPYLPLHSFIIEDMHQIGFSMRGDIVWNKGSSASTSTAWGSWVSATNPVLRDIHEYILVFCKDVFTRKNPSKRSNTISEEEFLEFTQSVWSFPSEQASRVGHPAPFPVELPYRLIQLYTFAEDVVLDPFVGAGTSCLAALKTGRRYVGYDVDEGYCSLAEQRIEQFRNEQRKQLSLVPSETNGQNV